MAARRRTGPSRGLRAVLFAPNRDARLSLGNHRGRLRRSPRPCGLLTPIRGAFYEFLTPCTLSLFSADANQGTNMTDLLMDLIFVALMVAFFALTGGLVRFCANLMGQGRRG